MVNKINTSENISVIYLVDFDINRFRYKRLGIEYFIKRGYNVIICNVFYLINDKNNYELTFKKIIENHLIIDSYKILIEILRNNKKAFYINFHFLYN